MCPLPSFPTPLSQELTAFLPSLDIVFLRAWLSVEPRKFYNPVTSLLLADKSAWAGMRLLGKIRRDEGLKTPLHVNSTYKPVERTTRHFNPLKISRAIQKDLPYASKIKAMRPQKEQTYLQKRAVVMTADERKASALLQSMQSLQKDKVQRRKDKQEVRFESPFPSRASPSADRLPLLGLAPDDRSARSPTARRSKTPTSARPSTRRRSAARSSGSTRSRASATRPRAPSTAQSGQRRRERAACLSWPSFRREDRL